MQPPITLPPRSVQRTVRGRWGWAVAAVVLLVLAFGRLFAIMIGAGPQFGAATTVVNPCTGETIALRERLQFLPHLTPDQGGSREASVNAVGLSGLGSRGTYYLPLGTGKAVFSFANGTLDFAAGGDLELIGRGNQGHDFVFHSLAHLKLSMTTGARGSGLVVQARCE